MSYDAFISYSHGADGKLAPALQTALHRFAKPWWKLRAVNLFRDGTSLAAAHDLSGAIKTALAASRFFVFLAAPRSAQSKWCQREVEYWIAERAPDTLLIVLTEGTILWDEAANDFDWTVTDALPRCLSGVFKSEPLWLDLNWARTGEQISTADPRFHQGVAMLAARLHGKSLDEIAGEDVRQHRRTRLITRAAAASLVALTVSSLIGAWYAVEGQRRAERNLEQALTATDTLVGDVADGMRMFYGVPRPMLTALLGRVEAIVETLATMEASDAILERRVELMSTLSRANIDIGNLTRADELARKAEALITPLAERDGAASAPFRRLSNLQGDLFDIARRRSDYPEIARRAERYRTMADASAAALTDATPPAVRYRVLQGVVLALERQTTGIKDQGRLDDALVLARQTSAAADILLAAFPNEATPQYLAASKRVEVAETLTDLGRFDEAMTDLDAARAKLGELDRANPNRINILQALVAVDRTRASIFRTRDDWLSAIVAYENNARVLRQLRNADPKNASLTSQVAGAVRDLALASERMSDTAAARAAYTESAALFADAMQASPDNIGIIENATRGLQLEASFLEDQGEREAALRKLDRAAEIGDALVLQRGADADGVLLGVTVLNARARLRNLQGETKAAAIDLERAEYLLGQLGRPAAPGDLERAVGAVVDVARQWGFAGQLDRSEMVVRDGLDLYALPQGASPAALVTHRIAMAKLLLQKSTIELDRGDVAAALATAEDAIRGYETDIVPHTRSDRVLDDYVQQLVLLGRTAVIGRDPARAREAYCAVQPKVAALAPGYTERPRVLLTVLDSEFLCLQSRFFGGDRDDSEKSMGDLAKRIDNAVPVNGGLMSVWRSLRARVAQLRTGMRVIAGDGAGAIALAREAVRYHEDAVRVPSPDASDLAGLGFMHGQLAELLDGSGDTDGARQAAEASVAAWKKASAVDRLDFKLEVKYAEAMVDAGALWQSADDEKARDLFARAATLLSVLAPRVPAQGRTMVAEQRLRALQSLGDTLYTLDRTDESIARHTAALAVAADLAAMRPDADANVNLARQHSRLARAFEKAKRYQDARDQGTKARTLFTANRDTSDNPASVDRMLVWLDTLGKAIDQGEAKEQAVASEAR